MLADRRDDFKAVLPAFSHLLVDPAGNAWLADYTYPGELARTYSILRSDGHWLGTDPAAAEHRHRVTPANVACVGCRAKSGHDAAAHQSRCFWTGLGRYFDCLTGIHQGQFGKGADTQGC